MNTLSTERVRTGPPPSATVRPPLRARPLTAYLLLSLLTAAGVWSMIDLRVNVAMLVDGYTNAAGFLRRVWPLELPPLAEVARQVGITLAIVLLATLLSVVLSIPLAVWAAANTQRGPLSRIASRSVIVAARAVPDIVLAVVFLRFFGLGSLPGVLAMGLHSVGMVGRLYADAIEQIDDGPRQALRAVGAGRAQQLLTGVLPQVLPAFVAVGLHRFDINLRISALLGYVGVAGVGLEMSHAFATLNFGLGISWALILVALCVLVEMVSIALRRALLGSTQAFDRYNGHTLAARFRARFERLTAKPLSPPRSSSAETASPRVLSVSPPWTPYRVRRYAYAALCVAGLVWSVTGSGVLDSGLAMGWDGVVRTLGHFWPPGTAGAGEAIIGALVVTVKIALAATLIGTLLALPLGSLAAHNVAPNRTVYLLARGFILAVRGLPELVLAVVFIVIIGLGPVAGTLALGLGSVGLLGKLIADSIEEIPAGGSVALTSCGASRVQTYFTAVLPQTVAALVGHVLYQLDVNIRAATLLGIVGGGGIGFYLLQATQTREYEVVTLIMLLVFVVVMAVELLNMGLRRLLW